MTQSATDFEKHGTAWFKMLVELRSVWDVASIQALLRYFDDHEGAEMTTLGGVCARLAESIKDDDDGTRMEYLIQDLEHHFGLCRSYVERTEDLIERLLHCDAEQEEDCGAEEEEGSGAEQEEGCRAEKEGCGAEKEEGCGAEKEEGCGGAEQGEGCGGAEQGEGCGGAEDLDPVERKKRRMHP